MKISVDSNVFISIHNSEKDANECKLILKAIEEEKWDCYIPVIVISEILVGYYNQKSITLADQFVLLMQKKYEIQPITINIAQKAAQYRAKFKVKLPDALIVASGENNKIDVLVSNDIKMQKKFPIMVHSVEEFVKKYKLDDLKE